ncbi:MAG TPA: DUF1800 domain-containing protein, partial [Thermoanaerobaculia bacterium]|nr:DUF1800 domain-containing protein [Thermoanaerobaculia bacterium]
MISPRSASTALVLGLTCLACAGNPHPQTIQGGKPLHLPWEQAGLTRREAAAHLLSRFSYGARPGEVDAVAALGPEVWLERQLAARSPEPGLAARLAGYPALDLSSAQLLCAYPADGTVRNEAKKDGLIPEDKDKPKLNPALGEEYEKQIRADLAAYSQKKGYHPQREILDQLSAQKLVRAVYAENQLEEVMTDFWFNHFNVSWTNDRTRPYLIPFERDAIRPNALGRFRTLLGATAHQPAMLVYLDNAQSVAPGGAPTTFGDEMERIQKVKPASKVSNVKRASTPSNSTPPKPTPGINENYARELMELHTLGVDGGYTQADVIEVARAFTGWTVMPVDPGAIGGISQKMEKERKAGGGAFRRQGEFLFRADQHDAGPKVILGQQFPPGRGIEDGEEVLDVLAAHPATAHHLAYQLAVRFVSDHPSPQLVDRLAGVYRQSGGDIRRVVRAIAESPEFWSPEARGSKVKSPFELAASALRALGADIQVPKRTLDWIARLGEPLYSYQPPTGYPDRNEAWLSSGTLLSRLNFGLQLASGRLAGVKVDAAALARLAAASPAGRPRGKGEPTPAQEAVGML